MHVCRRFLLSRLLFIVILCIRIDILDFFECNSAFCRCFHESVCRSSVFPSSCVSLACFLAVCCLFFVFLGCFLCFDIFHWLLRRWMVVYGSSRCVSCMLLSFCVGLLVCDFYGDFLCFYCISLHFIVLCIVYNVFDVAMVRESCLLRFTCFLVLRAHESPYPRLWTHRASLIVALLSMSVHVCCGFFLFRLLFIAV